MTVTKRKTSKRKTVSAAELKRQLAAAKRENEDSKRIIAEQAEMIETPTEKHSDAVNNPVLLKEVFESLAQALGPGHVREFDPNGNLPGPVIDVVDKPINKEKADMLIFMEEELLVEVLRTADKTAPPLPFVCNDGRTQFFIRGEKQKVKRKFVEILARCKKMVYDQEEYLDGFGHKAYRYPADAALMYPFQVHEDPNPKGNAWLQSVLAEPV